MPMQFIANLLCRTRFSHRADRSWPLHDILENAAGLASVSHNRPQGHHHLFQDQAREGQPQ
jgi:hypothetical protein